MSFGKFILYPLICFLIMYVQSRLYYFGDALGLGACLLFSPKWVFGYDHNIKIILNSRLDSKIRTNHMSTDTREADPEAFQKPPHRRCAQLRAHWRCRHMAPLPVPDRKRRAAAGGEAI